jgi:hypothetical protein
MVAVAVAVAQGDDDLPVNVSGLLQPDGFDDSLERERRGNRDLDLSCRHGGGDTFHRSG